MPFLNFDLRLVRETGGYRALVVDAPAGQANGVCPAPPPMVAVQTFLARAGFAEPAASSEEVAFTTAEDLGAALFGVAFPGEVRACLLRSQDEAARRGASLRIRLRLADAPELAVLPWELLYDAHTGGFVALSARTPVVRYEELSAPSPAPAAARPLRVLVLLAAPAGAPPLDAEREWRALSGAFAGSDALAAPERVPPTLAALQRRVRGTAAHVLHIVAHGAFDTQSDAGTLLFEDEAGDAQPIGGDQLAALLGDAPALRLVVLQACESAATNGAPLSGVARRLVRQGVPAVIAMQFRVSSEAAALWAGELYRALGDGASLEAATAEARKAVFSRLGTIEWAAPSLFLRADGALWGEESMEETPREQPWWERLPAQTTGDVIIAQIGSGASGVAVGKNITQLNQVLGPPTPDDPQQVEAALARIEQELARIQPDSSQRALAQFQLTLLRGELGKTGANETPSAGAITAAAGGLLDATPALRPSLAALFGLSATGRVVARAGDTAVAWVQQRFK